MVLVSFVSQMLAILTIIGQIIVVVLLISLLTNRQNIILFFGKHAILFSFIVSFITTLGSLFYSEIAGYEPCKLCWFQRILMYPQVILFGIALWKNDKKISDYIIGLSGIGALIAGYHYLLQLGIAPSLSCSAVGYSLSCSKIFVMTLGYITIPLMSFTAFMLILLLQIMQKKMEK